MKYFMLGIIGLWLVQIGCTSSHDDHAHEEDTHEHSDAAEIRIGKEGARRMGIAVGSLATRPFYATIRVSGELRIPPQNFARVTTYYGANIVDIRVIEGDSVRKGQPLAYITHPDLIRMQSEYIALRRRMGFLQSEYERERELFRQKISSAKEFQKAKADYEAARAQLAALRSKLRLLQVPLHLLDSGQVVERIAVRSPLTGFVQKVLVNIGQYVEPQTELFEIIDPHHVHADLMVFEKDMYKVRRGQKVVVTIDALQGQTFEGTIFAVGKAFEENPKALHLHAELDNKHGLLLPGTYVRGEILGDRHDLPALPEDAFVEDGDRTYVFEVRAEDDQWVFVPVEVVPGERFDGWVAVDTAQLPDPRARFAVANAYAVYSEWKKGEMEEAGHAH